MARRRDNDRNYIEPRRITTIVDGVAYEGTLYITPSGPNRYQYSVSYGNDYRTNTEDLMPSIYLCEVHGTGDLASMVAEQNKGNQS